MNPPTNPKQAEARAAMCEHNAPLLVNPPHFDYYLTWPAQQAAKAAERQWRDERIG